MENNVGLFIASFASDDLFYHEATKKSMSEKHKPYPVVAVTWKKNITLNPH